MQRKTEKLHVNASKLEMIVNIPKTKVLKINSKVNSPISLQGEDIETVVRRVLLYGQCHQHG